MGHLLFLILHVIAILFGLVLLFLTIPLHIIYTTIHDPAVQAARRAARMEKTARKWGKWYGEELRRNQTRGR